MSILVLVEHLRGEVRDVTFEMLAKANALAAGMNSKVTALLLTDSAATLSGKIGSFCDDLVSVEHPSLKDFNSEAYQNVLSDIIGAEHPTLVMIGHSSLGVDLAPSLAVKTGLPLVADVVGVAHDANGFLLTRQMYAGKINAEWRFKGESGIVTVRSGAFKPENPGRTAKAFNRSLPVLNVRRSFLGYEEAPSTGVDITKATAIIAVGRGIKDQKNMALVESFAKSIGAEIGCSRPVIDAGWMPKDRQIGSSGKTVKPKLYIGLGISGAFQHTAGMKSADTIIAVNKDPNAPIFALAHYGIVGDILKVIPALEAKIKELRGS
jgi:electron transfer flavoprotein alpha subunit